MKKSVVLFTAMLLTLSCSLSYAQNAGNTPESLKTEAVNGISVAIRLVNQAQKILNKGMTRDNVQTAMDLYAQAGQLFEKSENIFRAIGANYVSEEDIKNCTDSKNKCIAALMKLKEILGQI